MKLLAHLTKEKEIRKEQSLKEHCIHTAKYAGESIGNANFYHTVYLAGMLHDMGKAKREFSEYLEAAYQGKEVRRGSVNHTFAGVIWLLEKYHKPESTKWERLTCEIIGYAVGSHHGLFDCTDLDGKNGFLHRLQKDKKELCYDEAIQNYFAQVTEEAVVEEHFYGAVKETELFFSAAKERYGTGGKVFFQISMLVRLVLSAVIYGDRRDTSQFMSMQNGWVESEVPWEKWKVYFEEKIKAFNSDTPLNRVRNDISRQCLEAAQRPEGIYRLNVPTGAGKTLSTLRMALAHAQKYKKRRIIFIIPLLSVLDQNVKVIREYIPEQEKILEHHSNVIREKAAKEEADFGEFLGESWNYPVVVSTMVQLLNILFSHEISAAGRMQALCDSVLIIDEVQSLPKKMTVMFNMAMNFLQQYCKATIVLSSATQPCFEELKWPLHFSEKTDLVRLKPEQLEIFKRAKILDYTNPYGMDWDECVDFCKERMEKSESLLFVCNTKTEARILFERMQKQAEELEWDLFHLSTSMCQQHRMEELERLKEKLSQIQKDFSQKASPKKLICVSTQLIEAGVELSFQDAVRVLAGIDNLAQTAGRCNRSNEYGEEGRVYLVHLKNENLGMLQEIKNAQDSTRRVLKYVQNEEESLIGEPATRAFYRYLFEATEKEIRYPADDCGERIYLADLLSNKNGSAENRENKTYILHQPFQTIGRKFSVFDQMTIDVVTPYGRGKELIEQLENLQKRQFDLKKYREILQQVKKYTVSIYGWQKEKLEEEGMLYSVLDGRVWILNEKAYDNRFGVIIGEQPVENHVL